MVLDIFVNNSSTIENKKPKPITIKKPKDNVFEIVNKIYDIINGEKLSELELVLDNTNDYNFVGWVLNHYLAHSKITREYIDIFAKMSYSLSNQREYIEWYVKFMIYNKIKFPKFKSWYKFEKIDKKITNKLIDEYDITEDELIDLVKDYYKNRLNLKEINYILHL